MTGLLLWRGMLAGLAGAFVGLLGHPRAVGDVFHITSDDVLTWNQVYEAFAAAAGAQPRLVHLASERIAALEPDLGPPLLGDKAHSMVFDNSKVKALVPGWTATTPFEAGAREVVAWHDAEPGRRAVDPAVEAVVGRLVDAAAR